MDSDDEREEYQPYLGVPGTIILINVYNPHKTQTPTRSHESVCHLIRHYLRQASTHYIGVCLFGTEETGTSSFASQNITEVFPLNLPNLNDYKKIKETDVCALGQAKEFIMSDALWHCSKMFASCKKQLLSRTILLLTRFDTPPISSDHNPTYNRVLELVESNIDIKLLNIAETDYEPNEFYNKVLINICKSKDVTLPKPIWERSVIEDIMYEQSHRHLANAQLYFEIGDGFEIGVGVYSLLKSNSQPKSEHLDRDTNTILTGVNKTLKVSATEQSPNTSSMDQDEPGTSSQMPVLKSEILQSVEYGSEKIVVTDSEKKMMSNPFGPPNLKLLGFIRASEISMENLYIKRGYFLYPNEKIMKGSTVAFKALHIACIQKSVVAICVLCTRVNAKPYIVALSPCSQPLNLNIEIGFDVIILPFIEHFRQLNVEEGSCTIPESHKNFMKKIVNQLFFHYKPQMFEDPNLNTKYRAIEGIALQVENMDTYVDTTIPDLEKFKGLQDELFEEIFGPFGDTLKRSAPIDRDSKKPKLDDVIDETELKKRVKDEKVNAYTVVQLKNILKSKSFLDLPDIRNMKKDQLVELVYKYFSE